MLTNEELQKIINHFDENELKRQGIFGICQYGGGSDKSFIRANSKHPTKCILSRVKG